MGILDPEGTETVLEITYAPGVPSAELLERLRAIYLLEVAGTGD